MINMDDFVMFVALYISPILFIISGRLFKKKTSKRNPLFGYRSSKSLKNDCNWKVAQKMMYDLLYKLGKFLLIISIVSSIYLFIINTNITNRDYYITGIVLFQASSILWVIIKVERALKDKTNDTDK